MNDNKAFILYHTNEINVMQAMDEPETTILTSLFNNVEYPVSVNERLLL